MEAAVVRSGTFATLARKQIKIRGLFVCLSVQKKEKTEIPVVVRMQLMRLIYLVLNEIRILPLDAEFGATAMRATGMDYLPRDR